MEKSTIHLNPEMGRFLVSNPFILPDITLNRAVVLIGEHNQVDGTVGFIINKPTDLLVSDALPDFPILENACLYFGGTVDPHIVHFIHTLGSEIFGSKEILPGVFWGGDLEVLTELIDLGQISTDQVRFIAGYSTWEPRQLSLELKKKTWHLAYGKKEDVFYSLPDDELWGKVLKNMGSKYSVMANFPTDPSLN